MKTRPRLEVSRRQLLQIGLATTAATLVPIGAESLFPPELLAQGQDPPAIVERQRSQTSHSEFHSPYNEFFERAFRPRSG